MEGAGIDDVLCTYYPSSWVSYGLSCNDLSSGTSYPREAPGKIVISRRQCHVFCFNCKEYIDMLFSKEHDFRKLGIVSVTRNVYIHRCYLKNSDVGRTMKSLHCVILMNCVFSLIKLFMVHWSTCELQRGLGLEHLTVLLIWSCGEKTIGTNLPGSFPACAF